MAPELQDDPGRQEYDEEQLLHEARNGSAPAFGCIYEAYAGQVFRYLFAHVDDRLDAEDLTEEVFLRTWQALPGYRERGLPFRAYLFRIAHNALIDHYRKARRQQPVVNIEDEQVQDHLPDPAQALHASLERKDVRRVLDQLPPDYRIVLDLRFLAELSPDETAQVMERSAGAVRVLQHRALTALRRLIEIDSALE